MSEFKIIETQEELNKVIGERIQRAETKAAEKYADWKSPEDVEQLTKDLNEKIKTLEDAAAATQQQLAEKDEEIAKSANYKADLVKTRIALKAGLKIDYADRLRGETEEDWEKDAEILAKDFRANSYIPPSASHEPVASSTDTKAAAKAKLAEWLNNT